MRKQSNVGNALRDSNRCLRNLHNEYDTRLKDFARKYPT